MSNFTLQRLRRQTDNVCDKLQKFLRCTACAIAHPIDESRENQFKNKKKITNDDNKNEKETKN